MVPSSRDVINGIGVAPLEEDDDDGKITDAVRAVLEKDAIVDPDKIRVSTHNAGGDPPRASVHGLRTRGRGIRCMVASGPNERSKTTRNAALRANEAAHSYCAARSDGRLRARHA